LAASTGKSIIPAVIFYTNEVMPRNKMFYFWPHKVEMHFLEPIPVDDKSVEDLKQESFNIMKEYYLQHCKEETHISKAFN
jgi:1-acyl-sn-glycerol-3-phosphate acyltransferase